MIRKLPIIFAATAAIAIALGTPQRSYAVDDAATPGAVSVQGTRLLRDGRPWIPHGFYQIAFEVAPANWKKADHPFWGVAFRNYSADEYAQMREAGADSVRIQLSQLAADPNSASFDEKFTAQALEAVNAARRSGLTVILCIQAESHVPGDKPIDLPDAGTRRVWQKIAPMFASDRGVMYELLNEPRLTPNAENWRRWKASMTSVLDAVRGSGAKNVVVVDGLGVGQVIDGAPLLDDAQVAYAAHPYALAHHGETPQAWDEKFGQFSHRAPVIITEWLSGGYFCDADTPASTVRFIQYLQDHAIGLEMGIWDWAPKGFGSVRQGFPQAQFSSYAGLHCGQPLFGSGRLIERWYRTGTPATTVQ